VSSTNPAEPDGEVPATSCFHNTDGVTLKPPGKPG
tara:strand:- start:102220 stop:102324 length:105 start_codon:yes stop_codon:yes gene_type:complete